MFFNVCVCLRWAFLILLITLLFSFFLNPKWYFYSLQVLERFLFLVDYITFYTRYSSKVNVTYFFFSLNFLVRSFVAFSLKKIVMTLNKLEVCKKTPGISEICSLHMKEGKDLINTRYLYSQISRILLMTLDYGMYFNWCL